MSRRYRCTFRLQKISKFMDNVGPSGKEKLSMEGKTAFLGSQKDMNDIIEAVVKVAKNIDKLT